MTLLGGLAPHPLPPVATDHDRLRQLVSAPGKSFSRIQPLSESSSADPDSLLRQEAAERHIHPDSRLPVRRPRGTYPPYQNVSIPELHLLRERPGLSWRPRSPTPFSARSFQPARNHRRQ